MQERRPWMVCVRVNRHDKAYFLHQLDGFAQTAPLLVTWDDARPEAERSARQMHTARVSTPWERRWRFPGGHRLGLIWDRLRARMVQNPLTSSAREMAELETLAGSNPPSVIYAHTGFVGVRLLALKHRLGVPLVVHFHGLDLNIKDPVYQRVLRSAVQHFDRVVVVGTWMIAPLVAMGYDAARISVIPMGAPLAPAPTNAPSDQSVRFIAVGRMIPYKGFDRTIAAFGQAHATLPDIRLDLVGDGPMRPVLETKIRDLGLGDAVVFHGQLQGTDTQARIARAHVLVHHALDEPDGPEAFGVVITEAMALSKPVIGSRCGGLPDQIVDGETGVLVDQNDIDAMARAMLRLATDADLRTTMGAQGRVYAARMFDAHVLARQAEDVLIEVAGK